MVQCYMVLSSLGKLDTVFSSGFFFSATRSGPAIIIMIVLILYKVLIAICQQTLLPQAGDAIHSVQQEQGAGNDTNTRSPPI